MYVCQKLIISFVLLYIYDIHHTNPVGGGRYCSLLLPAQHLRNTESSISPDIGKLINGEGGGSLARRPHIVVRFFISLPHLNLFLLLVNTVNIVSLRTSTLQSLI